MSACDFVSAEAGIIRQAQTIPGHRYQIEAWGEHVRSESLVELSPGVDLSGGAALFDNMRVVDLGL